MIEHFSIFIKNFRKKQLLKKENKHDGQKMSLTEKIRDTKNEKYASEFGIDFYDSYSLPRAYINNDNAFFTYSGLVYFYPPNDGTPLKPFSFFKDHNLVLKNDHAYKEIENLDEILLQMVDLIDKAFDKKIAINPYAFMLSLDDEIEQNYNGKASLVMTNRSIVSSDYQSRKYFINRFLDHFIGWNFGVSVNRSEELKEALIKLNDKVIEKGLREDAGPGYGVYGLETEEYKGLQHYTLPKTKDNVYKKKNKI